MKLKWIHYGSQYVDEEDINEVLGVLRSDFLSSGPKIKEFEERILEHTGAQYCAAVANGTAALHLAVKALDIDKRKTGITSPITFIASANTFIYNSLKPDFADIDEKTYCMDPVELGKRINNNTAVIIPVHFAGQPCDMEAIRKVSPKNVYIIEDAAHAIGSKYENGKPVGCCCYSDMTIFSFHPVKTITTGEGGAITTNDKALYEKLVMLRNHGLTKDQDKFKVQGSTFNVGPWYYEMQELGYNYRITDIQAALGLGQLRKLERFIKRRREIISFYNEAFKDLEWLTTPYERPGVFGALHLYVIKIDFDRIGKTRTQVMTELKEKAIGTQVHYIPVHLQPYYREHFGFKEGDYPKAEQYYRQCLSIPLYPKMTDEDINRVINAIKNL
ncbi:MAG: UDP-4-amino-4,6-dideoxy-N-acetyl-beta-L-altrosamine transaminase [Candidatus Aminicenantes bacterium]|nr:UDP-4-amino-4,6-dideoxy-N-acetyl-beta-L-altrosamine transaminase [Candidatus Aminicenantes bacterium]NIM84186.1 UDP-4-amino-4,6-dideoxy-N-acetyl-beta-L-altrosamine transaminase [Candidatus Aminicenantes bacterium]NIN23633.1 UDP-4-amino-4,6-dideoxy-N-acetyl-beta-L-altrosamine transaminase [Candidatus Aminicenantes bacterium]NIN47340.1 UDP-4-amino-4,6-dideoxy-N-acetyl-beta-L-altrosamine transaminase [Candidatus Aminicenantes bacterium]NIN90269.1 UDP-4-amino-4,6-dideoxy-N-acetyl-beta-L-altrosam